MRKYIFLILVLTSVKCYSQSTDFEDNIKFVCEGVKCRGINFSFRYPKLWKSIEPDRPHVVAKVFSENGKGLQGLVITLFDEPKIVNSTLRNIAMSSIPKNSNIISYSEDLLLEDCKTAQLIYSTTQKKLDLLFNTKHLVYVFKYKKRVFTLTFLTMNEGDEFERFLPLFKKMALSLTLTDRY